MLLSSEALLLMTLFVSRVVTTPSEIDTFSMSKNYTPRDNDVRDSHLERVQVKQETGFDGKVRSIRFGFEPEQDKRNEANQIPFPSNFNFHPVGALYKQNAVRPKTEAFQTIQVPKELHLLELISPKNTKSARSKRTTDQYLPGNDVDDLETAEAKVFRPLFVYRQQVSRRLRLQNDRRSNNNRRQIQSVTRPRFNRYYYPYRYSPYSYFN